MRMSLAPSPFGVVRCLMLPVLGWACGSLSGQSVPTSLDLARASTQLVKPTNGTDATPSDPLLDALLKAPIDRSAAAILAEWSRDHLPADTSPSKPASAKDVPGATIPSDPSPPTEAAATSQADPAKVAEAVAKAAEFARWVTRGEWKRIGEFLAAMPDRKHALRVYERLLTGLASPPQPGNVEPHEGSRGPGMQVVTMSMNGRIVRQTVPSGMSEGSGGPIAEFQVLTPEDVLEIIRIAPRAPNRTRLGMLAMLVPVIQQNGHVLDPLVAGIRAGVGGLGGSDVVERRRAGRFWLEARESRHALEFLPDPGDTTINRRVSFMELLADFALDQFMRDRKPEDLANAWKLHQQLFALPDLTAELRKKTLGRLAALSVDVHQEMGKPWLEESFQDPPERGVRLLELFGVEVTNNLKQQIHNPNARLKSLRLQNLAAEALVRTAPDLAGKWRTILARLAENWAREAEIAHQFTPEENERLVPQWDNFGNMFYAPQDPSQFIQRQENQPLPIPIRDLLECQPGVAWMDLLNPSQRPHFDLLTAQLHLKIQDEKGAFAAIERAAPAEPQGARELVHRFLEGWTRSHDPNAMRQMYNPYVFIYGMNQQAETIPLTRSKQERNLADLKGWITRIRQLPIEAIDEGKIADAFTACHSSAEVYKLSAFEEVFGEMDSLKPSTTASILEKMRANLATSWRKVKTQEEAKTKRKEKEVQQEVLRGYNVAIEVASRAQKKHAADWRLQLSRAALEFDRNDYRQSVAATPEFLASRRAAMEGFAKAAKLYAKTVATVKSEEYKVDPYATWFYASLGASELGAVSHESVGDPTQLPLIRQAILDLGGSIAEHHFGEFAHALFERMGSVQPQVKFRYVRSGFDVVGDHPRGREAKKSLDYYADVVRELDLVTRLDGGDQVGADHPFGMFVSLLHTPEMERESGGFEKYVQNQNGSVAMYNNGRPSENYRDRFQEAITKKLGDHFEVISVTFENPKHMRSRPSAKGGWRETPLAYVLLKAKGRQVDKIPALDMDVDFLDSSGYVVIPIDSAPLAIDASKVPPPNMPEKLEITQTLDERQWESQGKLMLEVKATAQGLVPELSSLVDLSFAEFVARIDDDQGVVPSEFDPDADGIQIKSDRSWLVELTPKLEGRREGHFTFCTAKLPDATNKFQRYVDADLVETPRELRLNRGAARWDRSFRWITAGLLAALLVPLALWLVQRAWGKSATVTPRFEIPRELNPFTVLGLLEQIESIAGLSERDRSEVRRSIESLERHYFSGANGTPEPDLTRLASTWVERAQ